MVIDVVVASPLTYKKQLRKPLIQIMHIHTIESFSTLSQKSKESQEPILCVLGVRNGLCLVNEIAESYLKEHPNAFELIKINGNEAVAIQRELSILNLPSAILLASGKIIAMFENIMAKHELTNALQQQ